MSGGLFPAKRTVSLSTNSRNGNLLLPDLDVGILRFECLDISVQIIARARLLDLPGRKFEFERFCLRQRAAGTKQGRMPAYPITASHDAFSSA